jgi:hypothetical protein
MKLNDIKHSKTVLFIPKQPFGYADSAAVSGAELARNFSRSGGTICWHCFDLDKRSV